MQVVHQANSQGFLAAFGMTKEVMTFHPQTETRPSRSTGLTSFEKIPIIKPAEFIDKL